ncbi:MAG: trigger factor [Clostridium sp.]|nr:trigger factor [Clostridium sp.]
MKKLAMLCLCGLTAVSMISGCSNRSADGKENLGTVELAEYKGVKVNIPVPEVTDDEVEARVKQVLASNPKYTETDRAAELGDVVNIDYVGTQDGVEFAGGKDENTDLTLGSGGFIDGFEDGLVGAKAGDKKELNLTFPEDYYEQALAGQQVVFQVTVNAVKVKEDAELNDAFVQSVSEYKTVDEYKDSIRQDLLNQKMQSYDLAIQQDVLQKVLEGSKFKLNKNTVSKRYNTRVDQYTQQAKLQGGTLAGLAQANGMDEGGLKESIYATVEDDMRNQLVLNTIASNEGMALEDADREAFAQTNGQTVETVVNAYGQEAFDEMALNYKVMKFLADNADNEAAGSQSAEPAPEETGAETSAAETTKAE